MHKLRFGRVVEHLYLGASPEHFHRICYVAPLPRERTGRPFFIAVGRDISSLARRHHLFGFFFLSRALSVHSTPAGGRLFNFLSFWQVFLLAGPLGLAGGGRLAALLDSFSFFFFFFFLECFFAGGAVLFWGGGGVWLCFFFVFFFFFFFFFLFGKRRDSLMSLLRGGGDEGRDGRFSAKLLAGGRACDLYLAMWERAEGRRGRRIGGRMESGRKERLVGCCCT